MSRQAEVRGLRFISPEGDAVQSVQGIDIDKYKHRLGTKGKQVSHSGLQERGHCQRCNFLPPCSLLNGTLFRPERAPLVQSARLISHVTTHEEGGGDIEETGRSSTYRKGLIRNKIFF